MALSIQGNQTSLAVRRFLHGNQLSMSTSMQRLSTGLRINSAKDDAAGLAITERYTAQIRGSDQAARNANDGISMLQTAEGALAATVSNLQRIRELAVQAANYTNTTVDRQAVQAEITQLAEEIDRTSSTAQFNGVLLFDQGRESAVGDTSLLAVTDGLRSVGGWLESGERLVKEQFGLAADGAALKVELTNFTDGAGGVAARVVSTAGATGFGTDLKLQVDMSDFTPANLPNGGNAPFYNDRIIAHEMVHAVMARTINFGSLSSNNDFMWFLEGTAEFIHGADERVAADIAANGGGAAGRANIAGALGDGFQSTSLDYSAAYSATRYLHDRIKAAGGNGIKDMMLYMSENPSATLDAAFANASKGLYASNAAFLADFAANGEAFIASFNLTNQDTGAIGGLDVDGGAVKSAGSIVPDYATRSGDDVLDGFSTNFEKVEARNHGGKHVMMQVGAQAGDFVGVAVGAINLGAMGLEDTLDVVGSPSQVIKAMDRAIAHVSNERAKIGAQLTRIESTIGSLEDGSTNLAASRARIQDADFASETTQLSRGQILQQVGNAMVAQANQMPAAVLALLRR